MLLDGIRILDCTSMLAGPYCCMMLGDLGAEIIKIEHPKSWDPGRDLGEKYRGSNDTSLFLGANRNKSGFTVDFTNEIGKQIFYKLVKTSDVVVINLRPHALKRLGLDYQSLKNIKNNIIYCHFSGFGNHEPYKNKAGSDSVIQAMSGLMYITGEEGAPPVRIGTAIGDMSGAIYGAFGIMSSLYNKAITGKGEQVNISLLETLIGLQTPRIMDFFATGQNPLRTGNQSPYASPVNIFKTKDGYISIAAFLNKFWLRLCDTLDVQDLKNDPSYKTLQDRLDQQKDLQTKLEQKFIKRTTQEWCDLFDKADIPNAPVYDYVNLFNDSQVLASGIKVKTQHATEGFIDTVKLPVNFSNIPIDTSMAAPSHGEHTIEILKSLGYSSCEIEKFKKIGSI